MRVLIVKTSSMGDIIHTLPALTDAAEVHPAIQFDWVVEENFAEIPAWHSHVKTIIPVALRRWRKNLWDRKTRDEFSQFRKKLAETTYDVVIDAQGLLKSAFVACLAKGKRVGGDWTSARDPLASLFYKQKCQVSRNQHAVVRMRQLFAAALQYPLVDSVPKYGVNRQQFLAHSIEPYLVFLHGTTWKTKHWPESCWLALAKLAEKQHLKIKMGWGNEEEFARANRIAKEASNVEVLPRLALKNMACVLASAKAIVAVDTGLCHLAAALNVPTVSLYGPTHPELTGAMGESQIHLTTDFDCSPCLKRVCAHPSADYSPLYPPCFTTLPAERVWQTILPLLLLPTDSPL